jgi:hypothetical protein
MLKNLLVFNLQIYHFSTTFLCEPFILITINLSKIYFKLKAVKNVFYLIAIIEISTFTFLGSFAT